MTSLPHCLPRNVFVECLMPLLDAVLEVTRPRSASFTALTKEAQYQLGVFSSARMRNPESQADEVDRLVITEALRRANVSQAMAGAYL